MKYWIKNVEKYNSCFSNNKNDGRYRNYWIDYDTKKCEE